MTISIINIKKVKNLSKDEKKDLHIVDVEHREDLHSVEIFNKRGSFRAYGKTTKKSLKKAVKIFKKNNY